MYSDAVRETKETQIIEPNEDVFQVTPKVYEKWKDWQPSVISHHGAMCCETAREWLTATDFSELGGRSILTGPRWLRQKFKWGCSTFPIYWCEAVRRNTLDCGALAAMTHEIFTVRGVKNYRVQMVQKFSLDATNQWTANWADEDAKTPWIEDDLIYHEGCAIVLAGNQIKIWDSSAGWWVDPRLHRQGYGTLLAVRLSLPFSKSDTEFIWKKSILKENCWQSL